AVNATLARGTRANRALSECEQPGARGSAPSSRRITTSVALLRSACAVRSSTAGAILFVAGVGQDGRETPRAFLDEAGLFPVLVQHLQSLGRPGRLDGPGRRCRGDGGGLGPAGAVRLRPCNASAIPVWNHGSILPTALLVHPGL